MGILKRKIVLFILAIFSCIGALAVPADSLLVSASVSASEEIQHVPSGIRFSTGASLSSGFTYRQIIFPAAAIALGGAGVGNHLIDTSGERDKHQIEDQLQYVPIVAYAGLGFIPGVKHEHNFGQRLMAGASAYIVMTAICQGGKRLIREPRPDTGARTSFPSGHTATAFCGAELTRIEYGNAYGTAAYAFAAATGVMRVVNNRHWCNDVLAGAGIGFLSAHIGYWLLPWENRVASRLFRKKKNDAHAFVAPAYEYDSKTPSVVFSMSF